MKSILYGTVAVLLSSLAYAVPITSNTLVNPTVQDFSDGDDVPRASLSSGPEPAGVGLDTVTWTTAGGDGIFSGSPFAYFLFANGTWFPLDIARDGFTGLGTQAQSMTFTFADPVAGVGGLVNYYITNRRELEDPNSPPVLSVFDSGGGLLESINLFDSAPIITDGAQDAGAFRGFYRDQADIKSFRLEGAQIVLDNLTWTRSVAGSDVPLPAGLPMLLAGLAGLGLIARRRG